jgi:hypothetical protein
VKIPDFPDLPDFDRLREIMDSAERASRLIEQTDLARFSHLLNQQSLVSAIANAERSIGLTDAFLKNLASNNIIGLTSHLHELVPDYSKISSTLLDPNLFRAAESIAANFDRLSKLPAFTSVIAELESIRPSLERYETELETAKDEEAANLSLRQGLTAVVEAVTGANLRIKTGADRLKLYILLMGYVLALLTVHAQSQTDRKHSRNIAELQKLQESQQQTIAVLGRAIQQLQEQAIGPSNLPLVEASQRSTLRLLPSGKSQRVTTIETGDRARVILSNGRWLYVELLRRDAPTGILGWVYRRNIRFLPRSNTAIKPSRPSE